MKITELFEQKTVLSLEIFPPKRTAPIETIYRTLDDLKGISPDFISVTYGAGGSENSNQTFEIASAIKEVYKIESVAHLTCIGLTRAQLREKLEHLKAFNIENILALRGDYYEGANGVGDFKYASEMIEFINRHGDFNIIAACYPEGHIECESKLEDIRNLKRKVDAGVSHLVSQLVFDNEYFYSFLEKCQLANIDVPIEAGIMPVVNKKQIEKMATLCGAHVPKKFVTMMQRYEDNPVAMRDAGIAYAIDQIVDLIAQG